MHFQTQYKMNRFDEIILKNLNDEGIRINNFVIKLATYLEEKFIESNEPLQKWMDNNAVDMYYKIAKFSKSVGYLVKNIMKQLKFLSNWRIKCILLIKK